MTDNAAMDYEYLIRRCHNVGRYGNKAADADVFRSLLRSYHQAKEDSSKENEYQRKLTEVTNNIITAINKALTKFSDRFTDDEKTELKDMINRLSQPTLEMVTEIINRATTIMVGHQIYPG
ncbi:MAG: hypothetical protein EOO06_00230 [Chitinophagaceae bacterium]|nr:MAG: hypothetical protein EOO06_00230 [Chitinophagaceae bacterium]